MKSSSSTFYDSFSIFYPLVELILRPQKRQLYRKVNNLNPGKLLEVGVGGGTDLQFYRGHSVTGIDTSHKMLERARKKTSAELLFMNGELLTFNNDHFDYVVLSHVIAVVDNPKLLLNELHRVLKPKGRIIILNHFTPDNPLKYLDLLLEFVAKRFHFRSFFPQEELPISDGFILLEEHKFSPLSYFKLLIYQKK